MQLEPSEATLHWEAAPRWSLWGRQSQVRVRAAALLLGGVTLLAIAWGGWVAWQQIRELETVQTQLQALRAAPVKPVVPRATAATRRDGGVVPGQALSTEQRQGLLAVARQLNIPWQELFEQLERATPPQVALVSVEPDGQRGTVRLQAEAKSLDTLLQYAAALQNQGVLGRLNYNKHETNGQDANRPMRLTFDLVLLPSRQAAIAQPLQERAR